MRRLGGVLNQFAAVFGLVKTLISLYTSIKNIDFAAYIYQKSCLRLIPFQNISEQRAASVLRRLRAIMRRLGTPWKRLGTSWWRLEAVLESSWGHLGAILGPSWGHLGAILGYLGPS